jgi:hypothetical protein
VTSWPLYSKPTKSDSPLVTVMHKLVQAFSVSVEYLPIERMVVGLSSAYDQIFLICHEVSLHAEIFVFFQTILPLVFLGLNKIVQYFSK